MSRSRQVLMAVGGVLLGLAILLPILMFSAASGLEDAIGALVFAIFIAPLLGIAGIVLLVVGAVRGRGQRQQQQVVIVQGPPPQGAAPSAPLAAGPPCRACGALRRAGARFCTACGAAA